MGQEKEIEAVGRLVVNKVLFFKTTNDISKQTILWTTAILLTMITGVTLFGCSRTKRISDNELSLGNLKQLGLALWKYTQDSKGVLPPLVNSTVVKSALSPYIKDADVFIQPASGKAYLSNTMLSRKRITDYPNPEHIVVLYESFPSNDNTRGVVFLNFHAERIPEQKWLQLKRHSGIR